MPDPQNTPPVAIKFPPRPAVDKQLVLPRRRLRSPFEVAETTAETQKAIEAIRSATRNPWSEVPEGSGNPLPELEKSLKQLAAKLEERERYLQDLEARLADRERSLAEMETLLKARESLVEAAKQKHAGVADVRQLSSEEQAALEKLKAEIERQQQSLQQQRHDMHEREAFLDESEAKLFEKVQEQQEKETELEQREDDLKARERRLREREALNDPKLAAALQAEKAAAKKKQSEFNE
jgi:chromosome segregation ATPase